MVTAAARSPAFSAAAPEAFSSSNAAIVAVCAPEILVGGGGAVSKSTQPVRNGQSEHLAKRPYRCRAQNWSRNQSIKQD